MQVYECKRTNKDKQDCVKMAIAEFPNISDRSIAAICAVSHNMVSEMRRTIGENNRIAIGRDGKLRHYDRTQASGHFTKPRGVTPINTNQDSLFGAIAWLTRENKSPEQIGVLALVVGYALGIPVAQSQSELAKKIGLSEGRISQMINGLPADFLERCQKSKRMAELQHHHNSNPSESEINFFQMMATGAAINQKLTTQTP